MSTFIYLLTEIVFEFRIKKMKEAKQFILPGFSSDGKIFVSVPVSSNEIVGEQGKKVGNGGGWSGKWPGNLTRRSATPDELARLEQLVVESHTRQLADIEKLKDVYPEATARDLQELSSDI